MDDQVFADGIGTISVISGTVRVDLVTYSPTEKDAGGQPAAVFRQQIIMTAESFLAMAEKFQEAAARLREKLPPAEPRPVEPIVAAPTPMPAPIKPAETPPRPQTIRPFP